MVCDEIIQRKFEEKEFEINEVVYSGKGMLVDHIFMIHVVVVEKITRRIGDNYCRALSIEVLTASADSSRIGLSLVRDLLITYYKCFVIHIGIGVWCH